MFKSLKSRLFIWYIGSLLLMTIFIILIVHVFELENGAFFLTLLFLTLAVFGFTIIYKITKSLTYLSSKMKMISSKNLDERIKDIQSEDEIEELAYSFNELLDRLHNAFKREQQFIADVAHELKTPLATLRSTIEVALQQKRENIDYQKALQESLSETHRLSSTLKNVLDLAWSETPQEQKNAKSFNLTELMADLLETAQKMAVQKKIGVSGSFVKDVTVYGFKDKLGRAILNIIDNAIKYTSQKGKIEMVMKKTDTMAAVTIKDTGRGISQKDTVHIFDRFYRGSSSEKVFGSGLGLAIAKAIILSHRGEIKVKSKIGQGTIFTIILPLT
ncbi:hypothetical protein A3A46_03420 [Candidatus Roizmanbacteria bacterium RIFCSPLOWO2_01_FULL_37_13]|uniref:histidine kinase n=1 Tax=Candidatus Roizmanbacteria bacterium RIFCSPHIGHO2_02_FULL_38_11 TaxID=1802039 RepID=A0A1F7GY30_9BACT|nr:MAG: hypothetical protein A3C25_02255 [Candidatus Roizmanbacteria bacterium RIFCSPHIGHO2_02_FULL_38_11]OGK43177.1 MAG: hypothetical protein A3A46_03420 [Candidatus Roizmanbacteria bacterium RIFCSPLOWO2_01_FULL_37_13]